MGFPITNQAMTSGQTLVQDGEPCCFREEGLYAKCDEDGNCEAQTLPDGVWLVVTGT